jgi:hypothetical protein
VHRCAGDLTNHLVVATLANHLVVATLAAERLKSLLRVR